jgi:hypothetical protein
VAEQHGVPKKKAAVETTTVRQMTKSNLPKVQAVLGRCLDGKSEPQPCCIPRCGLCVEITNNSHTCDDLVCLCVDGDPGIEASPPARGRQRHARSVTLPSSGAPLIDGTYRDREITSGPTPLFFRSEKKNSQDDPRCQRKFRLFFSFWRSFAEFPPRFCAEPRRVST